MALDNHVRRGHPIIFGLLIIFSIIELAISAWLVARFNQHHNYLRTSVRDRVRFVLFASIWTLVLSPFFLGMFFAAPGSLFASVASHAIFLFITWVFWLSGAAALAASYGGRLDCDKHYVYCGQQNALEAFAWIEWVLLTIALCAVAFMGARSMRSGEGARGPMYKA